MELRTFGSTDLRLSAMGLGGLLARYEGVDGHPPPEEKRRIYLRAAELGINLFDMGYGDEVHIPDELKGPDDERFFSLKARGGAPSAEEVEDLVDEHLRNLRREAIDILRIHHRVYVTDEALRERIEELRQSGKVRALCLIRHYRADQDAYAERGCLDEADGDLVMYNYVYRDQEPGIEEARRKGKGVLIMKALGGQWLNWQEQASTDWTQAGVDDIVRMAPRGEPMRNDIELVLPIVSGPWMELARPGASRHCGKEAKRRRPHREPSSGSSRTRGSAACSWPWPASTSWRKRSASANRVRPSPPAAERASRATPIHGAGNSRTSHRLQGLSLLLRSRALCGVRGGRPSARGVSPGAFVAGLRSQRPLAPRHRNLSDTLE